MKTYRLSDEEIKDELSTLQHWNLKEGKLYCEFEFADFVEAFAFMTRAALISEQMNHHPEWTNTYNRVAISLTTHAIGGISPLDFEWARAINTSI